MGIVSAEASGIVKEVKRNKGDTRDRRRPDREHRFQTRTNAENLCSSCLMG